MWQFHVSSLSSNLHSRDIGQRCCGCQPRRGRFHKVGGTMCRTHVSGALHDDDDVRCTSGHYPSGMHWWLGISTACLSSPPGVLLQGGVLTIRNRVVKNRKQVQGSAARGHPTTMHAAAVVVCGFAAAAAAFTPSIQGLGSLHSTLPRPAATAAAPRGAGALGLVCAGEGSWSRRQLVALTPPLLAAAVAGEL